MDCRETLQRFYEFIDSELPDSEAREVARHLEVCRACFDRVEFEKLFHAFVRAQASEPVETGELRARLRARMREIECASAPAGEELFESGDAPAAEEDDLDRSGLSGEVSPPRSRIPAWSYMLVAAALVLLAIPMIQHVGRTDRTGPLSPVRALHEAAPDLAEADPTRLSDWFASHIDYDPMVEAFADAGCCIEGGTVDSVWAVLYGRIDSRPLSVFVARAGSFKLPGDLEAVQIGERTFWTATERNLSFVFWEDMPHRVICGAAANIDAGMLIALAQRVEAPSRDGT